MNGNRTSAVRAPPALNPEQLALVQPWKDFVSRGLISTVSVVFSPGGTSVKVELSSAVPVPEGVDRGAVAPGLAKQILGDGGFGKKGPGQKKTDGKDNQPMPNRSLCKRDLEGKDVELLARIRNVANKIGGSAAAGRIGSLKLWVPGVENFAQWWSSATGSQKVRLLTDEKHFKEIPAEAMPRLASLLGGDCPFRGTVPTPPEEEQEQSAPKPTPNVKKAPAKAARK